MGKIEEQNYFPTPVNINNKLIVYYNPDYNTQYTSIEFHIGGLTQSILSRDGLRFSIKPGTAHLLEHLILDSSDNQFFINYMINGARVNGYTHLGSTIYNIEMKEFSSEILAKFTDEIFYKEFDYQILNKQKQIITEEIRTRRDFPPLIKEALQELLNEQYDFFTVVGTKDSVDSISIESVNKVRDTIYTGATCNVLSFGPTKPQVLIEWHQKLMKSKNTIYDKKASSSANIIRGKISFEENKSIIITFIEVICSSKNLVEKDLYTRLFLETFKYDLFKNAKYNLSYHTDFFLEIGVTVIRIDALDDNFKTILLSLNRISSVGFEELNIEELDLNKLKFKGDILSAFDYPERISGKLHWLIRNGYSLNEYINLIDTTTYNDVVNHVTRMFKCLPQEVI